MPKYKPADCSLESLSFELARPDVSAGVYLGVDSTVVQVQEAEGLDAVDLASQMIGSVGEDREQYHGIDGNRICIHL